MNDTATKRGAREPVIVQVAAEHDIARARREAKALAKRVGFGRVAAYHVATGVSELASNLFFHATGGGTITLAALRRDGEVGVEVVAEDDGPGIADIGQAMEDGFTTNRGLGSGLPGVRRLMDEFDIASAAGVGTRVITRKWQPCK